MDKLDVRCRELQAMFHTDYEQAFVEVPVYLIGAMGEAYMVTLIGRKFGASKGVAALYFRPGCLVERGRQEKGMYCSVCSLLQGG